MSLPLTPFERWQSGTNQNSVPANNNSLRAEIFNTDGIADDVTAQPGSPDDGDWYIIPDGATGAQWGSFSEDSIAIYYGGTWYEFVPQQGNVVTVAGVFYIYDESDGWESVTIPAAATWGFISGTLDSQTDLATALDDVTVVTEASAFTIVPATHKGRRRWIQAGGDVTFDDAEALAAGQVYNIRATAAVELVEDGVTLTPAAGGSLNLTSGMAVSVVMTSGTAGVVIGGSGGSGAVDSVNGQTGVVVLDLGDLDDVDTSGASNGDVLTWNAAGSEWEPQAPSGGGSGVVDVNSPAISSGTLTLDFDSRSRYVGAITLTANVTTLAFSNLPGAGKYAEYELHIAQDATGSRTFAIPASHKALGGSDTAIASAANAVTVLTASTVDNGTTWRYAMQESA